MDNSAGQLHIDTLGESALLVTLGEGISDLVNSQVCSLAGAVRAASIRGVLEVVPAYSSVLVTFDCDVCTEEELRAQLDVLLLLHSDGAVADTSRTIEVPVRYGGSDGPDLKSVASQHGLSAQEVVGLHTAPLYSVYFLGFMPGFAYMGGLDPRLATPRLATPRVHLPAGSVGIAGDQAGVYPLSSPGGWQIIGRTGLTLWDALRNPPALLTPGDQVRFVATEEDPGNVRSAAGLRLPSAPAGLPVFEVLQPGALTTVQDMGRHGYAHMGLSGGGAMDPIALSLANGLLGNAPSAAALEITWNGPTLRAQITTVIAVAGADMGCTVTGHSVPTGVSWLVRAGSLVQFRRDATAAGGLRSYLAVAGGFDVPMTLGSRSTYLPAAFGGYEGRALRTGDILRSAPSRHLPSELAGRMADISGGRAPFGADYRALRFVRYVGHDSAPVDAVERLLQGTFLVSQSSDRMGIRLEPMGDSYSYSASPNQELVSFGVVRGAIQLPPGGVPLVLGADHQTTGGYPVAGVVARVDWPVLAALLPGQRVRFEEISVQEARRAYSALQRGPVLA